MPYAAKLHVAGFGTEQEVAGFVDRIAALRKSGFDVTFYGALAGDKFSRLLRTMDVGLALQDTTAKFNSTSFPSKVLSYLSAGLGVVSTRAAAVEQSSVSNLVAFVREESLADFPEAVSKALEVRPQIPNVLAKLDQACHRDLKSLLRTTSGRGPLP